MASPGFTHTPVSRSDATPRFFEEIASGMALKHQVLPEEVSCATASFASPESDVVQVRTSVPIAVKRLSASKRYSGALPPCALHSALNFLRSLPCSPLAFA